MEPGAIQALANDPKRHSFGFRDRLHCSAADFQLRRETVGLRPWPTSSAGHQKIRAVPAGGGLGSGTTRKPRDIDKPG